MVEGSTYAKWISRMFNFANSCDGIELKLTSVFYKLQDIRCYYKLKAVGFDGDVADLSWIPFNPNQIVDTNDDDGRINKIEISGLSDNANAVSTRPYKEVAPMFIDPSSWQSLVYTQQDLARFDAIAIKIVMQAENPCQAPLIDDFMMICSE
jgi:hypothetical protein